MSRLQRLYLAAMALATGAAWTSLLLLLICSLTRRANAYTDPADVAGLKDLFKDWEGDLTSNWSGDDPCASQWQGVSCLNGSVIGLDLNGKGIRGNLSAAIGRLQNLKTLSLQKNSLGGVIPEEIGNLTSLTVLKLSVNNFFGTLPSTINRLSNLQVLSLHHNSLSGPLPGLSNLTQLTDVFLQENDFNGSIPPEIGTFKSLRTLQLSSNRFSGPVPTNISQLSRLSTLYIDHNMLSGPFPDISGLKSLQYLWVQNNELTGPIPADIGYLSSLQNLGMEDNHFNGSIPASIIQLSSLPYLFLQNNDLSGPVPDLSGLINLQGMSLTNNSFKLVQLPEWVSTLQNIQLMFLDNCSLTGTFPSGLVFGLSALTQGRFDNNKFNGTLDVSNVSKNLTLLSLENNLISDLTGAVPNELQLLLGGNSICNNGSFPFPDLCEMAQGRGPRMWTLNILCPAINCSHDEVINPTSCNCSFPLATTILLTAPSFNSITAPRVGAMERQLANAVQLSMDQVRITIANFTDKTQITASVMYFPPASGIWERSKVSFIQSELNKQSVLTGFGVYKLVSLTWPKGNVVKRSVNLKKALGTSLPIFVFIVACACGIYWWRRHEAKKRTLKYGVQQELAKHSLQPTFFQFHDLKLATHDFDSSNKLGEGGFGEVYKGVLPNGTEVAVKRLFPARIQQGTQEFVNEVAIITGVLHRNLVKLTGCCVEETERILVYEFVEHNSLYHALFDSNDALPLDWRCRFDIAIGTARGLAYLHEECATRIIHRDIKASNILLDKNLNPKIADFGLARLFPDGVSHVSTRVAGTFGYVAPEYGLYGQLTEKADTFSFGVVLLELVSGRKSITLREEIVLLLDWAWQLYEEGRIQELADPKLNGDYNEQEFRRLIHVALLCTQANPTRRPPMPHVVSMLLGERPLVVPTSPGILSEIIGKSYSTSQDESYR